MLWKKKKNHCPSNDGAIHEEENKGKEGKDRLNKPKNYDTRYLKQFTDS